MEPIASNKSFGGEQSQYQHQSKALACSMHFSVFLPPQARSQKVPVIFWLSGLTCTDQNFVTKAGAQAEAARLGIAIVCPDTSPRGDGVADDPDQSWDFGLGAGFYLNATEAPYKKHYQMQTYITAELFNLVGEQFPIDLSRAALAGHSMGGHGALTLGLKNPDQFQSVSAIAPIAAPTQCPWGEKAFRLYLGEERTHWEQYDATHLVSTGQHSSSRKIPIKIDQGEADDFLKEQLKPELFLAAAKLAEHPVEYQLHDGYDHSFFFISTCINDHLRFHNQFL